MTDTIRQTGLGHREGFRWWGKWPPLVERVAVFGWCKPFLVAGEALTVIATIAATVTR